MSISYSDGLSPYTNKGVLGRPEVYDCPRELNRKVDELVTAIKSSKLFCVITGAGISTSAGIPDFRGPTGVWTMEEKKMKVNSINFTDAKPTFSHSALTTLAKIGKLKHLISQNVDGLHLRSGFPADRLVEVHGNFFCEVCTRCNKKHFRDTPSECFGRIKPKNRVPCVGRCRGTLKSTVLDWEDMLPREYFDISERYIRSCDLLLVLGSSLEIKPVSTLPAIARKNSAKVIYVNLQIIKNKYFNFGIHAKVDDVLKKVMENLNVPVPREVHPYTLPILHSEFPLHEDRVVKESQNQRKRKLDYSPNFESKESFPKVEETIDNCSNNDMSDDRDEIEIDKDLILEEKVFILQEKVNSDEPLSPTPDPIASTPPDAIASALDPITSTPDPIASASPDPIASTSPVNSDSVMVSQSTDSEVQKDTIQEIAIELDIRSAEEAYEPTVCENCPRESDDTQNLTIDNELDQSPSSNIIEKDG